MLKAIEKGMVNLVITKDLSRLSRNYLESGRLIEEYFPRHGVRYIAMNDNVPRYMVVEFKTAEAEEVAADEDVTAISLRLIAKNRAAYEELAK